MTAEYDAFLAKKQIIANPSGFDVPADTLNPTLFDWQRQLDWLSLRRGKSAIFADCGLGKSPLQLEWAYRVHQQTNKPVLIVAPLAVSRQTAQDEAPKFVIKVKLCREQADVINGINITNYEKIHHFRGSDFAGIVCDESSILKGGIDSKTYQVLVTMFRDTPYKLCCTATPAPNDFLELLAHIEFLGLMDGNACKASFFTHDGGDTKRWTLRPHAEEAFWRFVASWAVMLRSPSDIGYDGSQYLLPPLTRHNTVVSVEGDQFTSVGGQMLLPGLTRAARNLTDQRTARKLSMSDRIEMTASLIAQKPDQQWVVWCNLNDEGEALAKAIPGAIEVAGRHDDEIKADRMLAFAHGEIKVLVTKPKIAGRGMNWQNCHNTVVCGLSNSYEDLYQLERRFWRFGQLHPVNVHIVTSELDENVVKNIERKQVQHDRMMTWMISMMRDAMIEAIHGTQNRYDPYNPQMPMIVPSWVREEQLV